MDTRPLLGFYLRLVRDDAPFFAISALACCIHAAGEAEDTTGIEWAEFIPPGKVLHDPMGNKVRCQVPGFARSP